MKKPGGTPALALVARSGVDAEVITYDHSAHMDHGYARDTAKVLGLDERSVFKTLVADVDGTPVIGVVPASATLNLKSFAKAAGGKKAAMVEPSVAERITGYVTGGISPLGTKTRLRVIIDASAEALGRMYVSGGKRNLSIGLAPQDLARLAQASFAHIAAER